MPATKGSRPDAANQAPACPRPPRVMSSAVSEVSPTAPTRLDASWIASMKP